MFHVGCPRPVAGLAAVMSGRVARHDLLAVDRGGIAFVSIGMAETADLGSHHPGRFRIISCQEQDDPGEGNREGCNKEDGMSASHGVIPQHAERYARTGRAWEARPYCFNGAAGEAGWALLDASLRAITLI